MKRAQNLARKAGFNGVRVLRVEEADQGRGYSPMPAPIMARAMDSAEKSTPISPGEISVGATMSFTFEMVK